ncbi:hypothetical protein PsorP6_006077 [Peronosclerospora sorghi]|uniref:Uncharacterized protein n=1 Tax=Peronosclerospora sorghi TaxID=230839 RepID=A0ACC0W342_9STRA|nr:hypothetical protein PsorP6_006077 [Peronosclerospora sorghi]
MTYYYIDKIYETYSSTLSNLERIQLGSIHFSDFRDVSALSNPSRCIVSTTLIRFSSRTTSFKVEVPTAASTSSMYLLCTSSTCLIIDNAEFEKALGLTAGTYYLNSICTRARSRMFSKKLVTRRFHNILSIQLKTRRVNNIPVAKL